MPRPWSASVGDLPDTARTHASIRWFFTGRKPPQNRADSGARSHSPAMTISDVSARQSMNWRERA
jgi:hypothetical protein